MSVLVQLEMPRELLQRLDNLVQERLAAEKPLPIGRWIKEHPDGRECFRLLSTQPRWLSCPPEEYQAFVKQSYRQSVGVRTGRPALNAHRLEIIMEALEQYLKPQPVAKARRA